MTLGLVLVACGGGGGGGNDGPSVPSGYTGSTSSTVISSQNAEEIVLEAYEGGSLSDNLAIVPMAAASDADGPRVMKIAEALRGAMERTGLGAPQVRPAATVTDTEPGMCGGSNSYTINVNDTGTSFNGTMKFTSYCSDGVTMSGEVTFSGSVNQSTQAVKMTVSMKALTVTTDGETVTVSGSMSFSYAETTGTLSMSMVVTDAAHKTYYINYAVAVTEGPAYDEFTMTGRFYAHDYGYVDLTTVEPVQSYYLDLHPRSGKLRFAGANNTWATLAFTGNNTYRIDCSDGTVITGTFQ